MKISNLFVFLVPICGVLMLTSCHRIPTISYKKATQMVAVQALRPAVGPLETNLVGRVFARENTSDNQGVVKIAFDYRIRVNLPLGAHPNLVVGQLVNVTLPIVNDQERKASVESIGAHEVTLLLPQQIQELNGQQIRVRLPLKSRGVYRLPFNAIYSPRGVSTQIFILKGGHVEARPIKVLALAGPAHVYVTGVLAEGNQYVSGGMDNLLSGDTVDVVEVEGGVK